MAGAASALAGCQTYERHDLEIDATHAAWITRSASDSGVRAFAQQLGASGDGAGASFDPSDGLSLSEAEVVALVFNPGLRVARLEADVARAGAAFAGRWDDPELGFDIERIVSGAGGANPWVIASGVGLTIPISGRLRAARQEAEATLGAELEQVGALEWSTRCALRQEWIEWSGATLRAKVAADLVVRLREVSALASSQVDSGSLRAVDAKALAVEVAIREADLIAIEAGVRENELAILALMGLAPGSAPRLDPRADFDAGHAGEPDGRAQMERANPELLAARARYEVAERALKREVREQYPDLSIMPGYGTDQGDDRVLLGLSLPIPVWNRNQEGVAEAEAQREVARAVFESTYEGLLSRLEVARIRLDAARAQRAAIESTVVPLAEEQASDVARILELGRIDPQLLLRAMETQHEARMRLIDARVAESIGAIRLAELVGPPARTQDPAGPGTDPTRTHASSDAAREGK